MCMIISGQKPDDFLPVKRSIRIQGHSTSIRLENFYWKMIDHLAEKEGIDTVKFLNALYDEVLNLYGDKWPDMGGMINFASLIRVGCYKYSAENGHFSTPIKIAE